MFVEHVIKLVHVPNVDVNQMDSMVTRNAMNVLSLVEVVELP